jgi:hypothetical protein
VPDHDDLEQRAEQVERRRVFPREGLADAVLPETVLLVLASLEQFSAA